MPAIDDQFLRRFVTRLRVRARKEGMDCGDALHMVADEMEALLDLIFGEEVELMHTRIFTAEHKTTITRVSPGSSVHHHGITVDPPISLEPGDSVLVTSPVVKGATTITVPDIEWYEV